MGLTSSLIIGRSALAASQLALQVTGNNIANVGSPGFHRQSALLSPVRGGPLSSSIHVGRGVSVADIRRAVDPALQVRLRNASSDESSATIDRTLLAQLESIMNELSGTDLSTQLGRYFNAFSELANNPASTVNRASVVEQGAALASFIRGMRADLLNTRTQLDEQLRIDITRADGLLSQIASLNSAITGAELGGATEGALRDQRDELLSELASLMDISVINRPSGAVDVLVGSIPVVLGAVSRGLEFDQRTVDGVLQARVLVKETREPISVQSGAIGARLAQRTGSLQSTIGDLDRVSAALIFEVNRLHTSGRPAKPLTDITAGLSVPLADRTLALNDPANATFAGLPFRPVTGSVQVVITDGNGLQSTATIPIDLDGIDAAGAQGFGSDTTLAGLVAALDAIPNLNASITPEGRLRLTTDAGFDVSFKDDTSGVLAVLGVNTYFQGRDARDIDVRADLRAEPLFLSVGLAAGTNETALAIAGLRDRPAGSLSGDSILNAWLKTVERQAVKSTAAESRAVSSSTVRASLESQYASITGVSLDEEAVNLIGYQQAYQGAARFIGVVNDLTQVLMNLV